MSNTKLLLLIAFAVSTVFAQQISSPPDTLNLDTSRFRVRIAMDRTVYLPGEAAKVTLEVANPGAEVQGLLPFISQTGCVYESWKEGDTFKLPRESGCRQYPVTVDNSTLFAAGERKQRILNTYDDIFDNPMHGGSVAMRPGSYRLIYIYGLSPATVDYIVADAKLEAEAAARLNDVLFSEFPDLQKPGAIKQYVHVLALRADGRSYICVSQSPSAHSTFAFRNPDGSFDPFGAAPFKRVATSSAPIASLSVVSDSQEYLTIEWYDTTGGRQTFHYTDGYPARRLPPGNK